MEVKIVEVKNNEVGGSDDDKNSRGDGDREEDGGSGIRWRRLMESATATKVKVVGGVLEVDKAVELKIVVNVEKVLVKVGCKVGGGDGSKVVIEVRAMWCW